MKQSRSQAYFKMSQRESIRRISIEKRREIIGVSQAGVSQRAIAQRIGCCLSSVNRIVQAYRDENRIEDAPRSGRPSSTTPEDDRAIIGATCADPFSTVVDIKRELSLSVSAKTLRRRLKFLGLESGVAVQKPLLTLDHTAARLQFAIRHQHWDVAE
ncbi:uncharacterized protein LOC135377469 [Ornithodoros turicata]|uniref:uncharacterized protein LOC135377469 n=1 Tax=Ornithodoros turicata TaxID=34597 RepID=UPI00313A2968